MTRWSFRNYIMFKSSRKKLIAIGCSYTADAYTFPVWPTHLAEKLDMECINLAAEGAGNDEILAKILDASLNEKNVGLFVIMWSEWQRMCFQLWPGHWKKWWHLHPMREILVHERRRVLKPFQRTVNEWGPNLLGANNPFHTTQKTLRGFIHAQLLLKDIPHLFIQGPTPITYYNVDTLTQIDCSQKGPAGATIDFYKTNNSREQTALATSMSPYLSNVIEKNFIGWPMFTELGGYGVDDMLDKIDPERTETRIAIDDTHPNEFGQWIMSEEIYNAYAKIYS